MTMLHPQRGYRTYWLHVQTLYCCAVLAAWGIYRQVPLTDLAILIGSIAGPIAGFAVWKSVGSIKATGATGLVGEK